jgi:hypothetical protein
MIIVIAGLYMYWRKRLRTSGFSKIKKSFNRSFSTLVCKKGEKETRERIQFMEVTKHTVSVLLSTLFSYCRTKNT